MLWIIHGFRSNTEGYFGPFLTYMGAYRWAQQNNIHTFSVEQLKRRPK